MNAALLTPTGYRSLKAVRRTVALDLRNKAEGNYNVRLISRYRTARREGAPRRHEAAFRKYRGARI